MKKLLFVLVPLSISISSCSFIADLFTYKTANSTASVDSSVEITSQEITTSKEISTDDSSSASEIISTPISSDDSTISSSEEISSESEIISSSSNEEISSEESSSEEESSQEEISSKDSSSSSSSSSSEEGGGEDTPPLTGTTTVDLFSFNDTHGAVLESSSTAGLSKTSTFIKNQKAINPNQITISQGDMWQGSAESNSTRGELFTRWMNELDFVSMTLGNHEFDWGSEYIVANAETANFPTLAINIVYKSNGQRASYCQPSTTFTRGGYKFGVIGAIGDCYSSISGSKVKDVSFLTGSSLTNLVKSESNRLRNDEDCDFIIYSIHYDASDYDESLSTGGYVDLVLEAHTHSNYINQDSGDVYHIQSGSYGSHVGHVEIKFDNATKTSSIANIENISTLNFSSLAEDNNTNNIINSYDFEWMYDTLGYNSTYRNASFICQLVADLYAQEGAKKWGADYDIVLGGGYISCRSPRKIPVGNVTYAQLFNLEPFDNDIVLGSISGSKLKSQFINTSNSNYYIKYVNSIDTSSINNSSTYYIVTDTYSSDYTNNGITVVDYLSTDGIYARDLLAEYVKKGGLNN